MFPQCMTEANYTIASHPPFFPPSIAVFGFISKSFAKAKLELHFFLSIHLHILYLVYRDNSFLICSLDS